MNDIFHEYMSKRLSEIDFEKLKTRPGPIVTISRAAGCSSSHLSHKLAQKLNQLQLNAKWEVISKEILHESAERLKLHPEHVKKIIKSNDKSFLNEVLHAFMSRDYHLERKTLKTIKEVIHGFAVEGHKIFIGRGAYIICSDIPDSVHIRIDAPAEWRINKLAKTKNISKIEAQESILRIENDRRSFLASLKGREVEFDDFDLTINQSKYNSDQMTELVIAALRMKNIIQ
jgi:cytidylate kinase